MGAERWARLGAGAMFAGGLIDIVLGGGLLVNSQMYGIVLQIVGGIFVTVGIERLTRQEYWEEEEKEDGEGGP